MSCVPCRCCSACRPRYQRLVDAIYPADPTHTLVKANMQKLTFYAISHPEKLDRIGEYLASKMSRDVYRQRHGLVHVSVEAMDQLLAACHGSPSLNLFVESFLKMVQKLLETNDTSLEILATESFVNFSNIEEDTPSYHRRYDFFISKFAALCHSSDESVERRRRLRTAGLRGLRGVVRKTVSDDLQANIWEKQHMEKIVPSVLFNLHDSFAADEGASAVDGDAAAESPRAFAETCLRELIGKASFGSMRSVLTPALRHCDLHGLWQPADLAVACFRAIMYSIQSQYSYVVIQTIIGHLDEHSSSSADMRVGMATVLSEIVLIAATSIGPSLLEIFNSLLRHLRSSVELQLGADCTTVESEKRYQETLINTMGDFANSLPDYQKVEVMMFVIGKVPTVTGESVKRSDRFLQHVLVKTLLKVATKYRTGYLGTVMTSTFLDPLLRLALVADCRVRLLTQQILHTLLDRHQNLPSLQHLDLEADVSQLKLTVEKCSRADQMFMKKNGGNVMSTLYKAIVDAPGNVSDNYDAILCTMSLLCVEVGCDDVLIDLFRLVIGLQSFAVDVPDERAADDVHGLVARFLNLASQLLAIPALCQHVQHVIDERRQQRQAGADATDSRESPPLFDRQTLAESLKASGKDVARLSLPFAPKPTPDSLEPLAQHDGHSLSFDVCSLDSSIGPSRPASRRNTVVGAPKPPVVTVDALRDMVNQPPEQLERAEAERTQQIVDAFRNTPFDELCRLQRQQLRNVEQETQEIMRKLKEREEEQLGGLPKPRPKNIFEIEFPEEFVY